jgi:hypothetical protein
VRLLATGVVVACATGCPADDGDPGPCDGAGDPAIELRQRGEDALIVDGSELPVFPPPQGGVWTELDVRLLGISPDEVESLRVDVVDGGGTILAAEFYLGEGLPLLCRMDGSIEIDNMPVGFGDLELLEQLDGVGATMTTTLSHPGGDSVSTVAVTLRADTF